MRSRTSARRGRPWSGGGHRRRGGVGKSRLLYEFTHSHRVEGWLTLEAEADRTRVEAGTGRATEDTTNGYTVALEPAEGAPDFAKHADVEVADSGWDKIERVNRIAYTTTNQDVAREHGFSLLDVDGEGYVPTSWGEFDCRQIEMGEYVYKNDDDKAARLDDSATSVRVSGPPLLHGRPLPRRHWEADHARRSTRTAVRHRTSRLDERSAATALAGGQPLRRGVILGFEEPTAVGITL